MDTYAKEQLAKPLDPKHVATRQQSGRTFSYIEAWKAIEEANRIFGFDGWHSETVELVQLGEPYEKDGKMRVNYRAKVLIVVLDENGVGLIKREGCGFGQGIDKDPGQAHESALKEAESDARKRALMTFGNPFGLALYDKTQANVKAPPPEYITDMQRQELENALKLSGMDAMEFNKTAKIDSLAKLPAEKFDGAMAYVKSQKENN